MILKLKLCISLAVPATVYWEIYNDYTTFLVLRHNNILKIISIFHGCIVWIEKSVTRVTDRHHEACRVMPNTDPE